MSTFGFIQLLPPFLVGTTLVIACYFFYTRYVARSRELCQSLERIGSTIRSMSDGDENQRQSGVGRVFQDTPYDAVWREFSKTLHAQVWHTQGQLRRTKYRLTIPASHFFSVSAIVDRQLGVEYFKHLPGILTGVGIIGTFSGLLFGLSNFDASDAEKMSQSVAVLLAGVRDAFYASAAAITAAMVITHWEKMIYRRCLTALDHLVNCLNGLFDGAVSEEYLATLVEHAASTSSQARLMKEEMIQAMVPVVRQLESVQIQQMDGLAKALENVLNESNRRLVSQFEAALMRQVKAPIDEMCMLMGNRLNQSINPQEITAKVIRARQGDSPRPSEMI